jgi:hypothetical protein
MIRTCRYFAVAATKMFVFRSSRRLESTSPTSKSPFLGRTVAVNCRTSPVRSKPSMSEIADCNGHSVNTCGRCPGNLTQTGDSISANPWDARLRRQMNKHRHLRFPKERVRSRYPNRNRCHCEGCHWLQNCSGFTRLDCRLPIRVRFGNEPSHECNNHCPRWIARPF